MPITKEDAPDTLPSGAKDIYASAFNSAYEGTCEDREDRDACAAKIAWSAVKNKYKKSGDSWERKSEAVKELSLYISKASLRKEDQTMRGLAVASDTDEDHYGDNMALSLFSDFIGRIEKSELAPENYRSDFWQGGMPYLSVAHYSDQNGDGVPGDIEAIYTDGNRLKQKFTLRDNKIGRSIFRGIMDDLYSEDPEYDDPIRISIAFIDYAHRHKDGGYVFERKALTDKCPECMSGNEGKIYLKGQLIHCAFTRVPVNPRTNIEQIEERSMSEIKTKKDDAASIVGEEVAEELEQREEIIGKSETLVVKSEEEEPEAEVESEDVAEEVEEVEEEIVEESETSEEVEEEERANYGPTSMGEMVDQEEERAELNRIGEIFNMFNEVMYNIFMSDIEDKKGKIQNATQEFQSMLEEKSMLVDEQEKSALDEAWKSFLGAMSELPSDVSEEEKLKAIQPQFNSLGEAVRRSIVEEVEEEEEVEVVEDGELDLNSLVGAIEKAVQKGMTEANKPLLEKFSLIEAGLAEAQKSANAVPSRRSISPSLVKQSQTPPDEQPKAKLSSLSAQINKSVGLPEDYQRQGAMIKQEEEK